MALTEQPSIDINKKGLYNDYEMLDKVRVGRGEIAVVTLELDGFGRFTPSIFREA